MNKFPTEIAVICREKVLIYGKEDKRPMIEDASAYLHDILDSMYTDCPKKFLIFPLKKALNIIKLFDQHKSSTNEISVYFKFVDFECFSFVVYCDTYFNHKYVFQTLARNLLELELSASLSTAADSEPQRENPFFNYVKYNFKLNKAEKLTDLDNLRAALFKAGQLAMELGKSNKFSYFCYDCSDLVDNMIRITLELPVPCLLDKLVAEFLIEKKEDPEFFMHFWALETFTSFVATKPELKGKNMFDLINLFVVKVVSMRKFKGVDAKQMVKYLGEFANYAADKKRRMILNRLDQTDQE